MWKFTIETPKVTSLREKASFWCIGRENRSTVATCRRVEETKKGKSQRVIFHVCAETSHAARSFPYLKVEVGSRTWLRAPSFMAIGKGVLLLGVAENPTFPILCINRWNSLSQEAVEAPSINSFKNHLEKIRRRKMDFFMDWWSSKSYGCTTSQDLFSFSRAALTRCSRARWVPVS